eukprot:Amastigsp_a340503_49.p2 type:complete len:256 gc:universal Amastigsp_a340503_49:959-192(-)
MASLKSSRSPRTFARSRSRPRCRCTPSASPESSTTRAATGSSRWGGTKSCACTICGRTRCSAPDAGAHGSRASHSMPSTRARSSARTLAKCSCSQSRAQPFRASELLTGTRALCARWRSIRGRRRFTRVRSTSASAAGTSDPRAESFLPSSRRGSRAHATKSKRLRSHRTAPSSSLQAMTSGYASGIWRQGSRSRAGEPTRPTSLPSRSPPRAAAPCLHRRRLTKPSSCGSLAASTVAGLVLSSRCSDVKVADSP